MHGQAILQCDGRRSQPDGQAASRATLPVRPARLSDVGSITLLVLIALVLRTYLLWNTEVAARDSVGYIRYAWQLRHQPWQNVLRHTEQPPLYAMALLGMSAPVRQVMDSPESVIMQRSAQLTSVLAGVLLVIPMYLLGKELLDRNVGFWAALLFQVLPATGRFLSDGVSEAIFLLLAAFALWFAARALRRQSILQFGISGLFAGLAYLTRTEGLLVAAITALVLVGCQAVASWRFAWKHWLTSAAALICGVLVVAEPYMTVVGGIDNKQSHRSWLEGRVVDASKKPFVSGPPLAVWMPDDHEASKVWWGLWALATELGRGAFYVGWIAASIGIVSYRHRFRTTPGSWLLLLLIGAAALGLWRLANIMGYLSDRHCLLILLCSMFWIAAGCKAIGGWVATRIRLSIGEWSAGKSMWRQLVEERITNPRALTAVLLLSFIGAALPKTLEPLHANRAGLRQAGLWLFAHMQPGDRIVDPYCWSHYYAGCVFREGMPDDPPPGHAPVCYVVLEQSKSEHRRLTLLDEARQLAQQGEVVYRWAGKQGKQDAEVLVYAVR